jgi:hypothetical protein
MSVHQYNVYIVMHNAVWMTQVSTLASQCQATPNCAGTAISISHLALNKVPTDVTDSNNAKACTAGYLTRAYKYCNHKSSMRMYIKS